MLLLPLLVSSCVYIYISQVCHVKRILNQCLVFFKLLDSIMTCIEVTYCIVMQMTICMNQTISKKKILNNFNCFMGCFSIREFLAVLLRYRAFFISLPDMLCKGENVVDDSTCWVGTDVVER